MQPDPEKASCDESAEKEILESQSKYARRRFSSVSTCHAGATFGAGSPDPPEALRTIPSLSLHDIPKMPIRVPTEVGDINGVKVLQHDLFTMMFFPLSRPLLEMETKDLTFVQLNQLIGRKTGGISVYPLTSSVHGKEDPCSHIIVHGKAMAGCAEDLFNLLVHALEVYATKWTKAVNREFVIV
ncbi:presequence protease 2, chloroplastic/mitochondrial-like isoform X2 [Eucalyptus grandis]|uniref:presequence protease 2, chloroplastic/mitochondrial-like isoform X2 n=1 Tax=Eucalyptus grandis TaxID=71139 RepID=UPI00192F0AAA|nr:presequence protease 2, chloroplastic/mitochondrial-like isoform X2 [Eucalyptus grandis]